MREAGVDDIYVSTEDREIGIEAEEHGASVILRPSVLANDTALSVDVLLHACHFFRCKWLAFVQCTAPLMTPGDVIRTFSVAEQRNADCTICCHPTDTLQVRVQDDLSIEAVGYDFNGMTRRQDRRQAYEICGSVWVLKYDTFIERKTVYGGRICLSMSDRGKLDIDNEAEFNRAKVLIESRMADIF